MNTQNCADLDQLTVDHWKRTQRQIETYITTLLPCEMQYANQQETPKAKQGPCDTLALLVGFSPDPLLQAIWAYRPLRIVLVLNSDYRGTTGKFMCRYFVDWIQQLVRSEAFQQSQPADRPMPAISEQQDVRVARQEATAEWVFQALTDLLLADQQVGKSIVVDITGAKKKMAAGAYLFAAYAGAQISYVDFEKYDPESRRPYGYSCDISPMLNPYDQLGLRDWQHVRNLYDQFAFGKAVAEVVMLRQQMERHKYLDTPEKQAAMTKLQAALAALEQWDNGDFYAAQKDWEGQALPKDLMPQAMKALGKDWPSARKGDLYQQHLELKQGGSSPQDSIFNHPEWLLVYAHDELDKIDRLIRFNNDYRSALLRSAGLDEFLLKARIAILWLAKMIQPTQPNESFFAIVNSSSATQFRRFLQNRNDRRTQRPTIDLEFFDDNTRQKSPFQFERTQQNVRNCILAEYWNAVSGMTPTSMNNLRGESIHTHLAIPRNSAKAAYDIGVASLYDFRKHWITLLKKNAPSYTSWQLDWNDLCAACGVTFLPRLPKSAAVSSARETDS